MSATEQIRETLEGARGLRRRMFRVRLPFLGELRDYSWGKFRADLVSGLTLTLVSIPQAIGFSLILGIEPTPVIAAVVIGGFVGALFFSSRHHVFGPTSSISLIVAATIGAHATPEFGALPLAVLMAVLIGVIQLAAGLLNFGEVTKFISRTVVVAYSTGIGVLLVASQLHNLVGIGGVEVGKFLRDLFSVARQVVFLEVNFWAVGIAAGTFLIFWGTRWLGKKWGRVLPEGLIALGVMGILGKICSMAMGGVVPFGLIRDEGVLKAMLPVFEGLNWGEREWGMLPELVGTAVAIAILGMLEAAAITKGLASKSGQKIEPNQELIGMGVANVACGLFGAVPGSSSFARSAVNFQSGAATQMSSMLSSVAVLLVLLFVTPVFNFIPVAALAAHLVLIGVRMVNMRQVRVVTRATKSDAVVFAVTLGACLLLKLDTAIYVGIGLALALFLQKSSSPTLVEYGFDDEGRLAELRDASERSHANISIIHVEGELFFGAADLFQEEVRKQAEDENIRVFILRMKNARHLDASAVMALENLTDYLRGAGKYLVMSGCEVDVMNVLRRSGFLKKLGAENVFPSEANLTMSTRKALQRAVELLKAEGRQEKAEVRVFYDKKQSGAA